MAGQILTLSQSDGTAVAAPSAFSGINTVSSANYTGTDIDGYSRVHFITGASDRTYTPPTASSSLYGRKITIMKIDSGAGGVAIAGTISGGTNNNTIKARYGHATIVCALDSSSTPAWFWDEDITESGTWTPARDFSTSNGTSTMSTQSGWYRRNGRTIVYGGVLTFADGAGDASGSFRVSGLPYSAAAGLYGASSSRLEDRLTLLANTYGQYSYVNQNSSLILFYWLSSTGGTSTAINATDLGTSSADVILGGSYQIAS